MFKVICFAFRLKLKGYFYLFTFEEMYISLKGFHQRLENCKELKIIKYITTNVPFSKNVVNSVNLVQNLKRKKMFFTL